VFSLAKDLPNVEQSYDLRMTVHQFTIYDIDGEQKSRRWATREAITTQWHRIRNYSDRSGRGGLNSDVPGMTRKDFNPRASV
jgi:hypothetical protein